MTVVYITIVERVDEVEADIARDQIEFRRQAARAFSGFRGLAQTVSSISQFLA
jgi:hypothetical protein